MTTRDLPKGWSIASGNESTSSSTPPSCEPLRAALDPATGAAVASRTFTQSRFGPFLQEKLAVQPSSTRAANLMETLQRIGLGRCESSSSMHYRDIAPPRVQAPAQALATAFDGGNAFAQVHGQLVVVTAGRLVMTMTVLVIDFGTSTPAPSQFAVLPPAVTAGLAKARPLR